MNKPRLCGCGSGLPRRALCDAKNIFVAYVCDRCEANKKSSYQPEIFEDPNYDADEPIDDDDDDSIFFGGAENWCEPL